MIRIDKTSVFNWENAIRGARNPMNSWDKSDSYRDDEGNWVIGENDHALMMKLAKAGSDHRKFMRQIIVSVDIKAPLFWWKEFDTYKVGTVANSCSTMHKIHEKPFSWNDLSCEELTKGNAVDLEGNIYAPELKAHYKHLMNAISSLNNLRDLYIKTKDKRYWRCMIEILPTSYNQLRTITFNYEVLANMYKARKNHKLDEWRTFCEWIESLPYSEIITLNE